MTEDVESKDQPTDQFKCFILAHYDELHEAACKQMDRESPDHSLQATALINEVYVKLAHSTKPISISDADHFKAIFIKNMNHVLIDRARHKAAVKAGGKLIKQELDPESHGQDDFVVQTLIIEEELQMLEKEDPLSAEVVRKRLEGYTIDEIAESLSLPRTTVHNFWSFGKAWLLMRLK